MKIGQGLLDVVNRAQRLLERLEVPPEAVGPVIQERRYRDTFTNGGGSAVDNWLASKDFKAHYQAAVEGTSYRASEVKKVEKKYDAYFKDTFESFQRAPVTFKAADLQRVAIRG